MTFGPTELAQQVEGVEQHNENIAPLQENITTECCRTITTGGSDKILEGKKTCHFQCLIESNFDIWVKRDPVMFSQAIESDDSRKWIDATNK